MIKLAKMTEPQFDTYMKEMTPDYASDMARNFNIPLEKVLKRAEEQTRQLFPDGFETKDQYVFNVEDQENGHVVGALWFHLKKGEDRAFIYHIVVYEAFRRQGYGQQMLVSLERIVQEMGGKTIGLSVFADNPGARRLYEKVGYQPATTSMMKEIGSDEL